MMSLRILTGDFVKRKRKRRGRGQGHRIVNVAWYTLLSVNDAFIEVGGHVLYGDGLRF